MSQVSSRPEISWLCQDRALQMSSLQSELVGVDATAAMRAVPAMLPGNVTTPLHELSATAAALNVERIVYKDEGERCGIGNFKAVGAAAAIYAMLAERVVRRGGPAPSVNDLIARRSDGDFDDLTLTAVTAGSHGRAVAWAASLFGCRALIFTHAGVDAGRRDAIAAYGAQVIALDADYDDAVRWLFDCAPDKGWTVVSDTSQGDYRAIPVNIMRGYAAIADEIVQQLAGAHPTHVFVQTGVGGLAGAVCGHFWDIWGAERPKLIIVEPDAWAGFHLSASTGVLQGALQPIHSNLLGLAAGRPSDAAWDVLRTGADAFVTIPDAAAAEALSTYASLGEELYAARPTPSAIAGLAALHFAANNPVARNALELTPSSRVLLFGTDRELKRGP